MWLKFSKTVRLEVENAFRSFFCGLQWEQYLLVCALTAKFSCSGYFQHAHDERDHYCFNIQYFDEKCEKNVQLLVLYRHKCQKSINIWPNLYNETYFCTSLFYFCYTRCHLKIRLLLCHKMSHFISQLALIEQEELTTSTSPCINNL